MISARVSSVVMTMLFSSYRIAVTDGNEILNVALLATFPVIVPGLLNKLGGCGTNCVL